MSIGASGEVGRLIRELDASCKRRGGSWNIHSPQAGSDDGYEAYADGDGTGACGGGVTLEEALSELVRNWP